MPDKPLTVAAYAAGASLAAVTVFYVFGPTFFIDGEHSSDTANGRKRGIVGLSNPANDCFINSVLQALAGLVDLRLYLIQELHRRNIDGPEIYEPVADERLSSDARDKLRELQQGLVTKSVKNMLDALNERPIYQKTISAQPLVEALERAFLTRINRTQQDAQEFLQLVAERLCDEYHAAIVARKRAPPRIAKTDQMMTLLQAKTGEEAGQIQKQNTELAYGTVDQRESALEQTFTLPVETRSGFPFEGTLESQIQCQHCRFRNKPSRSNFVTLTLNVPQKSATTLDHCFDILLKTEDIEDFKCDNCRLGHALAVKTAERTHKCSAETAKTLDQDIRLISRSLEEDPEKAPEGVELPPLAQVPRRRIKRYMRITSFPKLLAIHLSRSIFNPTDASFKNAAKVSFPEKLRLGGILDEQWYRLLGIVCHKGSHHSGHYESFRRNYLYPPFATSDAFGASSAPSSRGRKVSSRPGHSTTAISGASDVEGRSSTTSQTSQIEAISSASSTPPSSSSPSARRPVSMQADAAMSPPSSPTPTVPSTGNITATATSRASMDLGRLSLLSRRRSSTKTETSYLRPDSSDSYCKTGNSMEKKRLRRKQKCNDRWWRISDDKIKECTTSDVLAMQREVYLLFYEIEKSGDECR